MGVQTIDKLHMPTDPTSKSIIPDMRVNPMESFGLLLLRNAWDWLAAGDRVLLATSVANLTLLATSGGFDDRLA
jgi:hypothetical protein